MLKIYKTLIIVLLTAVLGLGLFIYVKSSSLSLDQIKTSLTTYVMSAEATQKMIVYELRTTEKITKTQKLNMLWKLVSVSDINVDMLVPVKYAYYIDFNEGFSLDKSGDGFKIVVPPLKSYEPAVDVSGITFVVNEAPLLYNVKKTESQIMSQLTAYLNQKSEELKSSYREQARQSVQVMLKKWLAANPELRSVDVSKIQIVFKDEAEKTKP
ncbi:MAG: hypothetical protein K2P92_09460 [Bdellovibrionaceae bacterium]|nr:hypothetical protein [Pseudobdellovibrionaceae bacterium]